MKKKDTLSQKDKEDWKKFIEDTSRIPDKDLKYQIKRPNNKFRFDLHGLSLDEANQKVKEIIKSCIEKNCREILLITGKGLHSNTDNDIYVSKDLSKLKFSVPEFINNNNELNNCILSISEASLKDGGAGAILIKLKNL